MVLGHHQGDIVETFLLNLFFGGKLAAMPPKLLNDEGDVYVLRPLAHVRGGRLRPVRQGMGYPIIPCDLCGSQDGLQRQQVKRMLDEWETKSPGPAADPVPGADPGEPEPPARPGARSTSRGLRRRVSYTAIAPCMNCGLRLKFASNASAGAPA